MKKALIVYGGWDGHDPEGVANLFKDILEKEDFEVVLSDTQDSFMEDLMVYDLIIPIWTMGDISYEAERKVCDAVAAGVGLAGCHGGMCDAFRNHTDWQWMTGAQWVAHPGEDKTYKVEINKATSSPLVEGIGDFEVCSEQYYMHVDPCINVLATTRFVDPVGDPNYANGETTMPVAFTKRWGKGRVYYNSLGHTSDVFKTIPEAKEMMRRGMLWAAR